MYTLQAVQEDGGCGICGGVALILLLYNIGLPVPCQVICNQLRGILADVTPPPDYPLGYLTTLNRDKWAELREEVNQHNCEQLEAIDSALFVLCLDDSEYTEADTLSYAMLHNYGANR